LRCIEEVHGLFGNDVDRQSSFEINIEKVKRHLRIDGAFVPGGIGWLYEMI
jgi:hypothetical protein